jgi:hypothetical protein
MSFCLWINASESISCPTMAVASTLLQLAKCMVRPFSASLQGSRVRRPREAIENTAFHRMIVPTLLSDDDELDICKLLKRGHDPYRNLLHVGRMYRCSCYPSAVSRSRNAIDRSLVKRAQNNVSAACDVAACDVISRSFITGPSTEWNT